VGPQERSTPTDTGFLYSSLVTMFRSTNSEDHIRRIHELCARATETEDPEEAKEITSQLRIELHAQIAWLRGLVAMHRSRVSLDDESKCA